MTKSCLLEFGAKLKSKQVTTETAEAAAFQANERKSREQRNNSKGNGQSSQSKNNDRSRIKCFKCGKMGHKSLQCESKNKKSNNNFAVLSATNMSEMKSDGDSIIFIIDSGATSHLVTSADFLENVENVKRPFGVGLAKDGEEMLDRKSGSLRA